MHDAYRYALPGGALRGVAPLELDNRSHRSAPRKPPGLVWCDSLLRLVLFR
jgi:hypothetical protein